MIFIVSLGPGGEDEISPRAVRALETSDVIIGYKTYVDFLISSSLFSSSLFSSSLSSSFGHKKIIASAMKHELERCRAAAEYAMSGLNVALVSSGDAGVYGMASPMLELLDSLGEKGKGVEVEIIPGITAACSAAALLGAPLSHDFAVVSLSDLLTPWALIGKRLVLAAEADFVICLYNPASRNRKDYLRRACEAVMTARDGATPSGWVRNAGREGQAYKILPLSELKDENLDMFCAAVIGNSETKILGGRLVTPRGYARDGAAFHAKKCLR